jgi:hypothetical protein
MTVEEYRSFYLDLTLGALGGNRAHFEITDEKGPRRVAYDSYRQGLVTLALVSLLESRFLTRGQIRCLRTFSPVADLPRNIDQVQLSCFLYVRDCFAHNPFGEIFEAGRNTLVFEEYVRDGKFPHLKLSQNKIKSVNNHELHLIILRFYKQNV